MSNKFTISRGEKHHLYRLAFDDSNKVYLQINDCKELRVKTNFYADAQEQQVTLAIPLDVLQEIVDVWEDRDE